MSKRRIYIDNSVFGGYYDEEFEDVTKAFFTKVEEGAFQVYFSDINETELYLAPKHVRDVKLKIPNDCLTKVILDEQSKALGEAYINEGILTWKSLDDAYHIAIASVNRIDVLISWNFKHIVNFDKIKLFNSVNLRLGYPEIDIRSPREFTDYEN